MQPIGKYIVVSNVEEEIKTDSGIILSGEDASQLRYKKARVIKPGTDVSVIKEDDEIYYDKSFSFTMVIHGVSRTVIREADVVVVLSSC
jgi:co-chaperonin GroES (HSP10)